MSPPTRLLCWHRKGGTGKTSLAVGCAHWLAQTGRRVLLLDTDPQGSAAAWGERFAAEAGVLVRADTGQDLWTRNAALLGRYDHVIVDCAPSVTAATPGLLAGAERLLIPTRPAWPDLWALEAVAALLDDCGRAGPAPAAHVLFNQVSDEDLAPYAAAAADLGLAVLPVRLPTDPAWPALFRGGAPPPLVAEVLRALA